MGSLIRKHLFILQSNLKLKELFPRGSIIPAFPRSKDLKELLAPSRFKLKPPKRDKQVVTTMVVLNAIEIDATFVRISLWNLNHFLVFRRAKKYTIRSRLSCDSKNVIYLASCKKCRLQYVGSTTADFRIRFRNHKSVMLTNKTCEVAVHFNKIPHTVGDFHFNASIMCRLLATLKRSIGS